MHIFVHVYVCVSMCVCSQTGLSERKRNTSQPKLTPIHSHEGTHCPCFTYKHTRVIERAVEFLSALKVLPLSQRVKGCSTYHILRLWMHMHMHVCDRVCLCACLRKHRLTHGTCSGCMFWLCQADHYYGVEGQVVWQKGPDIFLCLN